MAERENIFEQHFANQQTVFLDRNAISPHFMPSKLPFREKQIEEISSSLSVLLNGKKADNLFLYGKTGCIAGDSLVYTSNGWKKIKEVDGVADLVLSFNKETNRYEWSEFAFLKFENKSPLLKITLENGFELTVTKDHPLLTSNIQWKKADELRLDDEVALGYNLPSLNEQEMPLSLTRLIGFTLSDGSLNRKLRIAKDGRGYYYNADRQRFRYFSADSLLLEKVQDDLIESFGGTPRIEHPKNRCSHVALVSQKACQALNQLGIPFGKKSGIIEMPKLILESSPVIQREFLKALFSGDGTVSQQTYQIEYYSNSKKFLQQIAYILYQEGIACKVRPKPTKLKGKIFDSHRLYIQGQQNIMKFYYKIGFYSTIKERKLETMIQKYVNHMPVKETGFLTAKIARIEETFEDFVYDLTVPKNHNFIANGIISHNTGKTSVTRNVLQQLLEFAGKHNKPVNGTYINCRNHNSKYRIMSKIVKELFPEENFLGFSAAFVYDKVLEGISRNKTAYCVVLDEIDKVKDLDDLVYSLTRSNDELENGCVSIVGISNNVFFKERLDPRTKSSLCQHEMVFPAYNAEELRQILNERIQIAFKPDAVEESAVNLASAFAANESGDARTAVMLLQKAGELADKKGENCVKDEHVQKAKKKVEEEIILNMIATLPKHQQLLLKTIASLSLQKKSQQRITGTLEEMPLFSGEVYEEYARTAKNAKEQPVSARWYREYISELEMFGLIITAASGQGIRGNTRLIRLSFDAKKIREALETQLSETEEKK